MNREQIYTAALAQIELLTAAPFDLAIPTIERGFRDWTESGPQPAIFLSEESEMPEFVRGLPTKWTLSTLIWIFATKDGSVAGVQAINPILDALNQIFSPAGQPPNQAVNTLGGLVHACALSGKVEKNAGYLGDQAVAAVPLTIITV